MKDLMDLGKKVAIAGGKEAMNYFRKSDLNFKNKSKTHFDPVSKADKNTETIMRNLILKFRPNDTIIGEENNSVFGSSGLSWIIDPIDGTRGFMAGQTSWTVLISLSEGEKPLFGIIYQPFSDEMFIGNQYSCEYLHQGKIKRIFVKKCNNISDAIIHTTDPNMGNFKENSAMEALRNHCKLARYSLDAYAYGLVAFGNIDLIVESSMQIYDIQAPLCIIKAAGGTFSDWNGGNDFTSGRILASGDQYIHKEALKILAKHI